MKEIDNLMKNLSKQLLFKPVIRNFTSFKNHNFGVLVVGGMGGSRLAGDLLKIIRPDLEIFSHQDYGLPFFSNYENKLFIVQSYSGNTSETLSFFYEAFRKKLPLIVLTSGGRLLALAKKYKVAYIKLPSLKIQPRYTAFYFLKALLEVLDDKKLINLIEETAFKIDVKKYQLDGCRLAKKIFGFYPIFYSSLKNYPLAYHFKIKFNETGKTLAFANFFPELNHNEMESLFFLKNKNQFCVVLLKDDNDDLRIQKRMVLFKKMLLRNNIHQIEIDLRGKNVFKKILKAVILADWSSFYLASFLGVEPFKVGFIEDFKKQIKKYEFKQ